MEWNETVVKKIHSILNIPVEAGKSGKVARRFSGLVFAKSGSVVYRLDGEEYISDGTNIVYLPVADYTFEPTADGICPQINFECDFDKHEFLTFPVSDIGIYEEKFEKLRRMFYDENSSHSHHACFAVLYDILTSLDRESGASEFGEYSKAAIEIMRLEFSSPELSNDMIASRLNISTVYFRKLFLKEVGISPMTYLRKMRMEKAKEYLKLPSMSVGETAYAVGYSGIYPFSRVFKKEVGISPCRYASKYKNSY